MSQFVDKDAMLYGAGLIFEKHLKAQLYLQGHNNSGQLIDSINSEISGITLDVFAVFYLHILNDGVSPDKVSMKQFPFLVKYFQSKGDSIKTAKAKAGATINKWKKTGMPTAGSKKLGAIEKAVKSSEKEIDRFIDNYMSKQLDKIIL